MIAKLDKLEQIKKTIVEVIPHTAQRYDTVGDWFFNHESGVLWIRVSDLKDARYNHLVAFHEYTEALLCMHRGIDEKNITLFDMAFERQRLTGDLEYQGEPGDHKKAPYRKEHFFATSVERLLAAELGVDWDDYDKAVMAL